MIIPLPISKDIERELSRQNDQWGANRKMSQLLWNAILLKQVGSVSQQSINVSLKSSAYIQSLRYCLVKVASVAVQNIIAIDSNKDSPDEINKSSLYEETDGSIREE